MFIEPTEDMQREWENSLADETDEVEVEENDFPELDFRRSGNADRIMNWIVWGKAN